jgi:7-cyano-7-deazaguanine reductase
MTQNLSDVASRSLGDSTSYAVYTDHFDPTLLNPMPRSLARQDWGLESSAISGFDRWNCHEATFLLNSGQPIAGTLSFVYSARSDFMIESKSMKLYLNSFDMCRMGVNPTKAIEAYVAQVVNDLSNCLRAEVSAHFHWDVMDCKQAPAVEFGSSSLDQLDLSGVEFDDFTGKRNHVEALNVSPISTRFIWHTNVLRSRCRHTKQKDTGTATVIYTGKFQISPVSVFKQIVSLREVNEFHEFCAEKLLFAIGEKVENFGDLSVGLFYARRGSLDINPIRWRAGSNCSERYKNLYDPSLYQIKTQGQ